MEILLYAPEFAAVPVSAMVLLAVSAILSAIPKSRGLLESPIPRRIDETVL